MKGKTKTASERTAKKTADTNARRFQTGVIATLVRDREEYVGHFTGVKADATRAVAEFCDRHGYKVRVLSTPDTIRRDLEGGRFPLDQSQPNARSGSGQPADTVHTPERAMLAKIGRLDLLADQLSKR